jgi:ABC-type Fe3+ transport system permease subunit
MLLAVISFVHAAGATSSIILLSSRNTMTLSLMALELSSISISNREAASIISIFIIGLTVTGAIVVRYFGLRMGIRHDLRVNEAGTATNISPSAAMITLRE